MEAHGLTHQEATAHIGEQPRVFSVLRRCFDLATFSVLKGDMTLVGPRPAIPYEVSEYPSWYRERFSVKPGLTGYWQVSGRNERTYEEMVRLDIEYAERRSLGLDLLILLKTPWVVLSRKGAA